MYTELEEHSNAHDAYEPQRQRLVLSTSHVVSVSASVLQHPDEKQEWSEMMYRALTV
jgi:hypothetical protein